MSSVQAGDGCRGPGYDGVLPKMSAGHQETDPMNPLTPVILLGNALDVLRTLRANSVHSVVTSPPYLWQRLYPVPMISWPEVVYQPIPGIPSITIPAMEAMLGWEPQADAYIGHLVAIFRTTGATVRRYYLAEYWR